MDMVGLIEGLSPSNGRIGQVLLSQLFGGSMDIAQFVMGQVLKGGNEFIKASCDKEEANAVQEQVERVQGALAEVAASITDEHFLAVINQGKKSNQNLGQLVANFTRDELIAPAVAQLAQHAANLS